MIKIFGMNVSKLEKKALIIVLLLIFIVYVVNHKQYLVDSSLFENEIKLLFKDSKQNKLRFLKVSNDDFKDIRYFVYDLRLILGIGSYANVYIGWDLKTKEKIAIKKFRSGFNEHEIRILKKLNQFIGYTKDEHGNDH